MVDELERRFFRSVDESTAASYHMVALGGWLRVRLLFISMALVSACTLILVGTRYDCLCSACVRVVLCPAVPNDCPR